MIRKAVTGERSALRALYAECFADGAAFGDMYFEKLFDPERCILLEREGEILAALYYKFEPLEIPGVGSLTMSYIHGVGTRASARGRGVARELMAGALRLMRSEGAAVAAIVPCRDRLFDLYRDLGFAEMFLIERTVEKREKITPNDEPVFMLPPERAPECDEIFRAVARWRVHAGRDAWMWTAAAHTAYANGGGVLAIERGGKVAGYAFYRRSEESVTIDELFCEDEQAFDALRLAVLDRCGADEAAFCAPACPHGARRFGMIRALDGAKVLELGLKRRPGDFEIELDDRELPENSLRYTARDGAVETHERRGTLGVLPGDLAALILGAGPAPYLNLVLS